MPTETRSKTNSITPTPNSPETHLKTPLTPNRQSVPTGSGTDSSKTAAVESANDKKWQDIVERLECRIFELEREGDRMKKEIMDLRENQKEAEGGRKRLEEKVKAVSEKVTAESPSLPQEDWRRELKATEDRIMEKLEGRNVGQPTAQTEPAAGRRKKRCVILADSNGRNAVTAESVKQHLPEEVRDDYEVEIAVTYRIEEAYNKVHRGKIDVTDALVIVDCLTNSVRDTPNGGPALSLDELVWCVDCLRQKLWSSGASDVIVCQIKPTQRADVSGFNTALHNYLCSVENIDGGRGCSTQVRLEQLGNDGLHIKPVFYSVLQKTYACAILNRQVPSPTPFNELAPSHMRNQGSWSSMLNRGARASNMNNGWTG